MSNKTILIHERVDDIPLLIGLMKKMELDIILNQAIPTHGNHEGIDHGNMALVWLAFILSQGDHRKAEVRAWVQTRKTTLEHLLGVSISETDFTDDRLAILLTYLSDNSTWNLVEIALWSKTLLIVPPNNGQASIRVDATTVSGYHATLENSLMQRGNSKDHRPDLGQFKIMSASHQPSGCLIASDIYSGESADDPLYVPIIKRVQNILQRTGLLYIGDCKMAALAIRAHIVLTENFYLTPLPLTGKTKPLMEELITYGLSHPGEVQDLRGFETGSRGFEHSRDQRFDGDLPQPIEWKERLLIIRTEDTARTQEKTLDKHLADAMKELQELTCKPGKGKKIFRTEADILGAAEEIIASHDVKGLLDVHLEKQETHKTIFVGRGRGSKTRPTKEVIETKYRIAEVRPLLEAIVQRKERLGWRIFVTNKTSEQLPISQAILEYRKGWCLERSFHLLKDQPIGISPLYVHNDEQIKGLTHLLLLANRILSEIELRIRGSLKATNETISGLNSGSPKQETASPTVGKLLAKIAKEEITLSRIETGKKTTFRLTPLSPIVIKILKHLGLDPSVYTDLERIKKT